MMSIGNCSMINNPQNIKGSRGNADRSPLRHRGKNALAHKDIAEFAILANITIVLIEINHVSFYYSFYVNMN